MPGLFYARQAAASGSEAAQECGIVSAAASGPPGAFTGEAERECAGASRLSARAVSPSPKVGLLVEPGPERADEDQQGQARLLNARRAPVCSCRRPLAYSLRDRQACTTLSTIAMS